MNAVGIKIGLGFVVVVILFGVAQTQVLNALMLFAAAGVIPGTDIALSPEATFYMLAGWAMLGMALLFRSHILRLRARPALEALIVEHLSKDPKPRLVSESPRLRTRLTGALRAVQRAAGATAKELRAELKTFKLPFNVPVTKISIARLAARLQQFWLIILMRVGECVEMTIRAARATSEWLHAFGVWLVEARLYIDRWFSK